MNGLKWMLVLLVMAFACCSGNAEKPPAAEKQEPVEPGPPTFTTEMIGGAAHIHNTGSAWGDSLRLQLSYDGIIGDSSDDNLTFFKPTDFALDEAGNIYVLDSGNHRIQKLDPDGLFLESFGKAGQGPGEFQYPSGIALDSQGNMYVTDTGTENLKVLNPEGRETQNLSWLEMSGHLYILSTGEIALVRSRKQFRYSQTGDLMDLFDMEGNRLGGYGIEEVHEEFDPYRYFNRIAAAKDGRDFIYVMYAARNKIEKYSPSGELLMVFDRPLNFAESSEVTYKKHQAGPREIDIPYLNWISVGIDVDERGRIWVLSYERQLEFVEMGLTIKFFDGDGRYEGDQTLKTAETNQTDAFAFHIFDPDGVFQGKIPIDHFAGIVRIYRDRLYVLETRHTMCIYKYHIVEPH